MKRNWYGNASAKVLLSSCFRNISKYNPSLNAIITVNDSVDSLPSSSLSSSSPLHSVPVLIKDSFLTEFILTTNGSARFEDFIPTRDSEIVRRLRHSGCVILGKTNLAEQSLDIQTFNKRFGTTNNPYDITLTSGGSSGGSAVGVACDMAPIAVGSDLSGSIRIPAAFCGVCSIRPTTRRLPVLGMFPFLRRDLPLVDSEFTVGCFAKNIYSLEDFMECVTNPTYCGTIEQDSISEYPNIPYIPLPNQVSNNNKSKSRIRDDISICITPSWEEIPTDTRIVDTLTNLQQTLQTQIQKVDLTPNFTLDFNSIHLAHKFFTAELLSSQMLASPFTPDPQLTNALTVSQRNTAKYIRDEARQQIEHYLDQYDVWILPVSGTLAFKHNYNHEHLEIMKNKTEMAKVEYWKTAIGYSIGFSVTGNPVVTMSPIDWHGEHQELAVGIQVVGKRWQDEKLLRVCRILEQELNILKPKPPPLNSQ